MRSEWTYTKAADFIEFNPKLSIRKNTIATKIAMDCLTPFTKKITMLESAIYSGGSKFCNGDTIMARITPCLENGKTAFVDCLADGEIGFGSTEFIVLRAIPGVSDPQFVYYLAISPAFRKIAIKSMVGSSGRQRVQQDVLNGIDLFVPSLKEQQKIGSFLAMLDDKIETNNKINENLEQQAQALFDNAFPYNATDELPIGWSIGTLGDITVVTSGKRPPMKQSTFSKDTAIPLVGAASIMGYTTAILYNEPILITGRVGTHGVVQRFNSPCWASDNTLVIKSDFYEFAYQILLRIDYINMNRGSTQPLITQTDLKSVPIVLPPKSIINDFEDKVSTLMRLYEANCIENKQLSTLRDTLLPKLMSGELDVSTLSL